MFVLTACSEVAGVCTEPSSRSRVITIPFTNTSRIVKLEIQVKVQVEARHGDSPKNQKFLLIFFKKYYFNLIDDINFQKMFVLFLEL